MVVVTVVDTLDCTETFPLLWPAGTVKLGGTGRPELLADKPTTAPPEGAGPLSVNDSVVLDPLVTVLGLIENPVRVGRLPEFTVTVMLAVWLPLL